MKKALNLLIILIILLLAACTPQIVRDGGVVVRGTPEQTDESSDNDTISRTTSLADDSQPFADADIVYATKTGKKYHLDGCSHLTKSKVPISLEQAKQQGLTPCSICYPAAESS